MLGSVGIQKQHMLNLKTKGVDCGLGSLVCFLLGRLAKSKENEEQLEQAREPRLWRRRRHSNFMLKQLINDGRRLEIQEGPGLPYEQGIRLSLGLSMTSVRLLFSKLGCKVMSYVSSDGSQGPAWCLCVHPSVLN